VGEESRALGALERLSAGGSWNTSKSSKRQQRYKVLDGLIFRREMWRLSRREEEPPGV